MRRETIKNLLEFSETALTSLRKREAVYFRIREGARLNEYLYPRCAHMRKEEA